MKDKSRSVFIGTLTTIALVLCLAGHVLARTVWVDGVVTKKAWTKEYQHIEVNNVKYTLMPKIVKITAPRKTNCGAGSERHVSIDDIKEGQKIWISIQGHRIYEITIVKWE